MASTIVGGTVLKLLRESMSDIVTHMIEDDEDPVTRGIILNTDRVKTVTSLGRNVTGSATHSEMFQAIHPIVFGRAGAIKYAALASSLMNDVPPRPSLSPQYPPAVYVPMKQAEWLTIPLKWIQGNLVVDRRQWLALTSGDPVEDFLADWLKDPLMLIRTQLTQDFFGSGVGYVASVGGTATIGTSTTNYVELPLSSSCRPLWRGQRLWYWDDSASSLLRTAGDTSAPAAFEVMAVWSYPNSTNSYVKIKPVVNVNGTDVTASTADKLFLEGGLGAYTSTSSAYGLGVSGLGNFIISPTATGSVVLHGLTIRDASMWIHPELISIYDTASSNRWPTPGLFESIIDKVSDRGFPPPTRLITTRGVRTLYYQGEAAFKTYTTELGGGVQRGADGGMTGNMSITTEAGTLEVVVSAFCPRNTAYLVRPDALVRYAPKGIDAIQFIGESELVGGRMFMVAHSSNSRVPLFEAPFDFWYEMGCLMPQCLGYVGNLAQFGDLAS